MILATAVATGAAVAAAKTAAQAAAEAALEAARITSLRPCYIGKTNEEIAAIKIQTAFRGYLVWTLYYSFKKN